MTAPPPGTFSATSQRHGHTVVVALAGDIDMTAAGRLADALTAAAGQQPALVVVDLAQVRFMDSTGIRCLLTAKQSTGADGIGMTIRGAHGVVEQVLTVTGVLDFLTTTSYTEPPQQPAPASRRRRWSWLSRRRKSTPSTTAGP
ncbi:anti-anti-sigma factor [Allocatelliglobosispora scoriae]|uniref:Anti-sigma factor antagonist n=1 Tax=Allocatelliglobosispora scoriae TaxID=643052 RepID=A0A841C4U8_9ACTN|nr:STAS domain-containing protein [Allocatelliglobosispora scoriae]MBB5874319.1 anti-anti-sigma factor [Allocatelliglobosispora scoriae]